MNTFIFLQSLTYSYNQIRDIYTIFDKCNVNEDNVRILLSALIKKGFVGRIKRGQYEITSDGTKYLELISRQLNTEDMIRYTDIIKNTEKEMDALVRSFQLKEEEYLKRPIIMKYIKNGNLIDDIKTELKGYPYFYSIEDDKLWIHVFNCDKLFPPASILYQSDIILLVDKEPLIFRDL